MSYIFYLYHLLIIINYDSTIHLSGIDIVTWRSLHLIFHVFMILQKKKKHKLKIELLTKNKLQNTHD